MAKFLFKSEGTSYRVPGLPYFKDAQKIRSVVLDDVPTENELTHYVCQGNEGVIVNPWTKHVIKGFRTYVPTTFRKATKDLDKSRARDLFGSMDYKVDDSTKVLLQLHTELDSKAATLDAAIVNMRRDGETVVHKAHLAHRLYLIGRLYGHLQEREYPFDFGNLRDPNQWDEALTRLKLLFIDFMREVPVGGRDYDIHWKKPELSETEIRSRFPYMDWLEKKLGDNLQGVLIYGSAARTEDPDLFSDFDNWVKVRDVRKAHEVLKGTCPVVLEGKVIETRDPNYDKIPGAKPIGIHITPDDDLYEIKHTRFLPDSREFLLHTQVLMGEFPFPLVEQDEIIERGLGQAHVKLKATASSLTWAYFTPEKLIGKPALFEFIVKNMRFFLQHSLNAIDEPNFRDKQMLDSILRSKNFVIPKYTEDFDQIKESLLYATVATFQLQKELMEQHTPNFDFMRDAKIYKPSDDIDELIHLLPGM